MSASVRRFRRADDGNLVVHMYAEEGSLLASLFANAREALEGDDAADAVTRRLFPRAYSDPTEDDAEQDWQAMVHDDLAAGRVAALADLEDRLGRAEPAGELVSITLDPTAEARLLGALNDVRLVLGTVLGVTAANASGDDRPRGAAEADAWEVYDWLTALEGALVDQLLDDIPEPTDGSD